jgi:hypothetical protein
MGETLVDFQGTGRFELVRPLGEGGMGVVYEVLDRERSARVALKTLRAFSPEALLGFKREFRTLQELQHPNLITLGELIEERGQWFFTMELVEGVSFTRYVRHVVPESSTARSAVTNSPHGRRARAVPPPTGEIGYDEERLRNCLRQLAAGLAAIHRAGKVHRDVKPSNILVTPNGRVVLLDFGLVTETVPAEHWGESHMVGTVDYMAPEQATGTRPEPAADWYSVGGVLYEALTGRPPFLGPAMQVLHDKQLHDPLPPQLIVPGVPRDLDQLCVDLLRLRPEQRPSSHSILFRLGIDERRGGSHVEPAPNATFVSRTYELGELGRALEDSTRGAAVTVFVHGESGLGKSALVARFVAQVHREHPEALVLSGRCYERESVPYKAFDGVVDALSRYLGALTPEQLAPLVPDEAAALALIFPVLQQVAPVAAALAASHPLHGPKELRSRAFAALRELLGRLAERLPIVIAIDDFQWADADSLLLWREVMRPHDAPSLLLVAAVRTTIETDGWLRRLLATLDAHGDVRHLHLERLPPEEARELIGRLLKQGGVDDPDGAAALAREAGGHPLFIEQLVRETLDGGHTPLPARLDDALWARVGRLDERARRLMQIVAVADIPLSQACAAAAAGIEPGQFAHVSSALRGSRLVRTTGARRSDIIEPYHDQIRATLLARLDEETVRGCFRAIALALEEEERPDAAKLWVYWWGAGELTRAAEFAEQAAERAAAALAFDRAAMLFRQALELRSDGLELGDGQDARRRLFIGLGDALASAGRGADAAQAYLAATDGSARDDAIELRRRAAEQLMVSGHVDEGIATIHSVLSAVSIRMARSPRRALASHLLRRAQLQLRGLGHRERRADQIPADELRRVDVCWSVTVGMGIIDIMHSTDFQTRHLLMALKAGEPYRLARALALEAGVNAVVGGARHQLTERLLEQAEAMARRIGRPHALGLVEAERGLCAFLEGRFRDAYEHSERAEVIFRDQCTGVIWELDIARIVLLSSLLYRGQLQRLGRLAEPLLVDAADRGDLFAATGLSTRIRSATLLADDQPEAALADIDAAMGHWTQTRFTLQHEWELLARGQCDLYRGDGRAALARLSGGWKALQESLLLRIQHERIAVVELRARSALAAADGPDRESQLASAERDARRIEHERSSTLAAPMSHLIRAGVAAARHDLHQAERLAAAAASEFAAIDMQLHAAIARRRYGELRRGPDGRALVDAANAWMLEQGIRNPARMSAMIAPGFS